VLVPVLHSAGRPHIGRLAGECDALLAGVCILPGWVGGDMSGVGTVTGRRRRLMTPRTKLQDHHLAMILINLGPCTRGPAGERDA